MSKMTEDDLDGFGHLSTVKHVKQSPNRPSDIREGGIERGLLVGTSGNPCQENGANAGTTPASH